MLGEPVTLIGDAELTRAFESGERFDDATANSNDQWEREVSVHPDCEGGSHWFVD
jgi:hypothetical protein